MGAVNFCHGNRLRGMAICGGPSRAATRTFLAFFQLGEIRIQILEDVIFYRARRNPQLLTIGATV